jgi:Na+/serine symporter
MKSHNYDFIVTATKEFVKLKALCEWLSKKKRFVIAYAVIGMMAIVISTIVTQDAAEAVKYVNNVSRAWMLILCVSLYIIYRVVGGKVWNKVKDMPKPIDLRNIKEML